MHRCVKVSRTLTSPVFFSRRFFLKPIHHALRGPIVTVYAASRLASVSKTRHSRACCLRCLDQVMSNNFKVLYKCVQRVLHLDLPPRHLIRLRSTADAIGHGDNGCVPVRAIKRSAGRASLSLPFLLFPHIFTPLSHSASPITASSPSPNAFLFTVSRGQVLGHHPDHHLMQPRAARGAHWPQESLRCVARDVCDVWC